VCVLFKPGALSRFTSIPVHQIESNDDPLTQVFGRVARDLFERVFEIPSIQERAILIESFLESRLLPASSRQAKYLASSGVLRSGTTIQSFSVRDFSGHFGVNPSTVYRNFLKYYGQGPKELHDTLRFRSLLSKVLPPACDLTRLAYDFGYFDQSHFIKDFRHFTGEAPTTFRQKSSVVSDTLHWITDERGA